MHISNEFLMHFSLALAECAAVQHCVGQVVNLETPDRGSEVVFVP